jgi:hypothetical protein
VDDVTWNGTDFRVGAPAITWSCCDTKSPQQLNSIGVDHHPVLERTRSCSLLFSYCNLASLPPRARHKTSFKLHKLNTTCALQSQSFPPSLPRSFPSPSPFHLSSCALRQHLSTQKPLPHSSRTLPPLYPFSPSFMCFPFHSFLITCTSAARCY